MPEINEFLVFCHRFPLCFSCYRASAALARVALL